MKAREPSDTTDFSRVVFNFHLTQHPQDYKRHHEAQACGVVLGGREGSVYAEVEEPEAQESENSEISKIGPSRNHSSLSNNGLWAIATQFATTLLFELTLMDPTLLLLATLLMFAVSR